LGATQPQQGVPPAVIVSGVAVRSPGTRNRHSPRDPAGGFPFWGRRAPLLVEDLIRTPSSGGSPTPRYSGGWDWGAPAIARAADVGPLHEPTDTYIAWSSATTNPGPCWVLSRDATKGVEHRGHIEVWQPVSVYRANSAFALIPLAATVLPADNPLRGVCRQVPTPQPLG
jgi:hypothetical protein